MTKLVPCLALAVALTAAAQTTPRQPYVRATGNGVISLKPDQMKLTVSVVNTADTAQQASDDNATRSTTLLAALKNLLGSTADIQTVGYSVTPIYKYPQGGQPILTGYQASNSLQITTGDLSIAGRLIDTAVSGGATSIGGLTFGLKDPQPARELALKLATQQARSSAVAIASGLNTQIGSVISVSDASAASPVYTVNGTGPVAATPTPVETGMVQVTASVVIEVQLLQ